MVGTLIGVLGATFFGVISTDTLCEEHRVLVEALATVAMICLPVALVGLWRGWAAAPVITLAASVLGISMGLIDAIHSPTRGALVAIGFGMATTLAALATVRSFQLSRWERDARARVASFAADQSAMEASASEFIVDGDEEVEPEEALVLAEHVDPDEHLEAEADLED